MKRDEWVKWTDQIENSLVRAEMNGKDKDIIILLRLAWQVGRDHVSGKWEKDESKS